ncbi:CPBP family intramembrane glutamic endopeptidase [Streptococcus merionis]|uniref:CAAX amino terminal protease family membrane protein n=1 Tax=Streptococcus merionis TaxID=400065 RepID=A0A239T0L5_9STRE|nr:type II CAAX endopeptidase family protein [Streptococcus merionis]SNU90648.1 CAAX amino terminal protease family membrane protein [Streptococcus merionis]
MLASLSWENKKRPIEAIALVIVFFATKIVLIRYMLGLPFLQQINVPYLAECLIVCLDIVILLVLLYVLKKRQFTLSEQPLKNGIKQLVIIGLIAFILISINEMIMNKFLPVPPLGKLPFSEQLITFFIEFPMVIISGPIFEEILFRGLLLKYAFPKQPIIGLVVSSFLFILAHSPMDWTAYWYHGLPAVVLGLAYNYTKTLKVPVGVHMAINFVAHVKTKFF